MRRVTSLVSLLLCFIILSHSVETQSSSADVTDRGSGNSSIVNTIHNSTDPIIGQAADSANVKLQIFVMLPLNDSIQTDSEMIKKWDRGLEMLPGAQVAVEAVNSNPQLLPGYELELVEISTDPCIPLEVLANINALIPFANDSVGENTIGIVGMFCDELVHTLSPLAGRDEFGLFQLSGSMLPPTQRNQERQFHLNFISASQMAYYETLFLLMSELEWERVLIVYETFYNLTHLHNSTSLMESFDISYNENYHNATAMVHQIRQSEKNIVYLSVGARQAVDLLCAAYDDGVVWPNYMWILEDHSVADLFMYTHSGCTTEKLEEAMENTILLRLQREQKNASKELPIMGYTYETYLQQYMDVVNELGEGMRYNEFANVMHDSVWAFALALNNSLDTIHASVKDKTVIDYIRQFGKKELAYTMEQNLRALSFEGVTGRVYFNGEDHIEAVVDINLIFNNTSITIGCYDQVLGNLLLKVPIPIDLPDDKLQNQYSLIPFPVTVILITVVSLCMALTTVLFILFIKYQRYSEIKATSPYLSLLMFLGTYLILIATLIQAILTAVRVGIGPDNDVILSSALCGSVITGNIIGINLIFSTLLLRMLRVYRIFSHFGRTGKIWSDKVLAVIVLLIVGGDVVLLLIWFCVDPFTMRSVIHYEHRDTPPHYEVRQYCTSNNIAVWFALIFGKVGVLFAIVLFLAIKTRKIQRENFKDTKKVNIYVFVTVLIVATLIPVWFLLEGTENVQGTGIVIYVAFGATGLLNQLMLFTPKVFPPMLRSLGLNVCLSPRSKLQKATIKRRDNSSLPYTYPMWSPPPHGGCNTTHQLNGLNNPLANGYNMHRTV